MRTLIILFLFVFMSVSISKAQNLSAAKIKQTNHFFIQGTSYPITGIELYQSEEIRGINFLTKDEGVYLFIRTDEEQIPERKLEFSQATFYYDDELDPMRFYSTKGFIDFKKNGNVYTISIKQVDEGGIELTGYYQGKVGTNVGQTESLVTVYENYNYDGKSQELAEGFYDVAELNAGIGNDIISSIKVPEGWKVTLYADWKGTGKSKVLTADNSGMDDFNDMTSSIRVEKIK